MALKKITFIGDIMCEPMLMKAAKKTQGYNFNCVFQYTADMFEESDFVIGNLETPLAGEKVGYTKSLFSFNAPDEFADALKNAGINLVITSNNHCLDRGISGLIQTIKTLENKGIANVGTFAQSNERKEATYFSVDDLNCAIVSYTYGTNYSSNHILLNDSQRDMVNLLRPQQELYFVPQAERRTFVQRVIAKILRMFKEEKRYYIKKAFGMTVNVAHEDDNLNEETMKPYLDKLQSDIHKAKNNADFVFFCPHVGGQFNEQPGIFSEYVFEKAIEAGCDAIIASHPHIVQRAKYVEDIPCFYSIGNFNMSPNSVYLLHENLPEYGIAVHLYLKENTIEKVSFSMLKMVESTNEALTVVPVDVLYKKIKDSQKKIQLINDVGFLYYIITGQKKDDIEIKREYVLPRVTERRMYE